MPVNAGTRLGAYEIVAPLVARRTAVRVSFRSDSGAITEESRLWAEPADRDRRTAADVAIRGGLRAHTKGTKEHEGHEVKIKKHVMSFVSFVSSS
jgi:hypothetical protein